MIAATRFLLASSVVLLPLSGCSDSSVAPTENSRSDIHSGRDLTEIHPDHESIFITGSGTIIPLDYEFSDFTELDIQGAYRVTVTPADQYSVKVRSDDNIVQYLDVTKDSSVLRLGLAGASSFSNLNLFAEISMPDLKSIHLGGISKTEVRGFELDHTLRLTVVGASRLEGSVSAQRVTASLSGIGAISLEGRCGDLSAQVSEVSTLDLAEFVCEDVDVDLSGASQATVHLTGTLNSQLSGASVLRYLGSPLMGDISTSGASRIERAD